MTLRSLQSTFQQGRKAILVGVCALPLMMGCPADQNSGEYRKLGDKDDVTNTDPHDHHYAHGPNGGDIVELGDVHGEVVIADGRILTLYILGADAKTASPVAEAIAKFIANIGGETKEIELVAVPLEGETEGKTSRFAASGDVLPAEIIDVHDLKGDVIFVIGGKENKATLGHDHDHDHDGGH
ncbi:hypothetical protein SH668x_000642 [Planctomicrobium sp. SH668]|uniref:hypothetical protein n=1 Tax=Planctomicrobium sp. SH668 TaxID=3448126 RepID=UPI003F5BF168